MFIFNFFNDFKNKVKNILGNVSDFLEKIYKNIHRFLENFKNDMRGNFSEFIEKIKSNYRLCIYYMFYPILEVLFDRYANKKLEKLGIKDRNVRLILFIIFFYVSMFLFIIFFIASIYLFIIFGYIVKKVVIFRVYHFFWYFYFFYWKHPWYIRLIYKRQNDEPYLFVAFNLF